MYHFIVRKKIERIFAHLNRGDFAYVQRQFADTAEHWFSGSHALAGTRTSIAGRAAWYERLGQAFPELRFTIRKIAVSGWPWRTYIAVEWSDTVGAILMPNQGVFMITLAWGKAVEFHVYCDTQGLAANLKAIGMDLPAIAC